MLPGMLFILVFIAIPIITSIMLSFFNWKGYGNFDFVGLKNYLKVFISDRYFYTALKNSIIFSISVTIGTVGLGFILAVMIDLKVKFWKFYRFFYFLPVVISTIPLALLWVQIFHPYGLLNNLLLEVTGLESLQRSWLGEPNIAFVIIILVDIWHYTGFTMIFFLAGMQNIEEDIYEAAKLDGATTFQRIFKITAPLLKNVFSIIIILQLIFSFQVFDIVYAMTRGGPFHSTEVLGTRLYQLAFSEQQFGLASVYAVVMFIVSIIYAVFYIRVSGYGKVALQS